MAATTNAKMIITWFAGTLRNIGIECGKSGVVVVDEDAYGELQRFADEHGVTVPETFTVTTSKGKHYYFAAREDHPLGNQEGAFKGYKINIRAGNAYVVGPGSVHATGVVYTIENAVLPVPVPDWLIAAIEDTTPTSNDAKVAQPDPFQLDSPRGLAAVAEVIAGPRRNSGGDRHQALIGYACSLRARSMSFDEAQRLYKAVWERCEQPPTCTTALPWPDALAKLSDVWARYPEGPSAEFRTGEAPGTASEDEDGPGRRLVLTSAAFIKPRRVKWLWDGRLALGTLALLAGKEGLGKSTLAYWGVAQITLGIMPGEYFGEPRAVLICATEDSWAHTIVPRLIAAGADLTKVYRVEVLNAADIHVGLSLPKDLHKVERSAAEVGAALLLLDPLTSRLDEALDTHKDSDVRRALEPLVTMADKTGMAVLGLIHHNKSGSTDPLQLVMASKAFTAVSRSVHTVIADPDDETDTRRLFGTPKNNLGRSDLPTLGFTVDSHPVHTDEGINWTGKLVWGEDNLGSIGDAMRRAAEQGEDKSATSEAADWLTDYLTMKGGTAASADVKSEGQKAGHSYPILRRARERLHLEVESAGFPRRTTWSIPSGDAPFPQSGHQSGHISRGDYSTDTTDTTGRLDPQSGQSGQSGHVSRTGDTTAPRPTNLNAGRCAECHWHIEKQGHRSDCSERVPVAPPRPSPPICSATGCHVTLYNPDAAELGLCYLQDNHAAQERATA
jgi:hypothetical protein